MTLTPTTNPTKTLPSVALSPARVRRDSILDALAGVLIAASIVLVPLAFWDLGGLLQEIR